MKLSRKILSVALACVLALSLFTACGVSEKDIERIIKEKGYITREEALSLVVSNSSGSADESSSAEKLLSYQNSRIAAAIKQLSGEKWQIEYSDGYEKIEIAKNGNMRYVKSTSSTGKTITVLYDGKDGYVLEYINQNVGWNLKKSDKIAVKIDGSSHYGLAYYSEKLRSIDDAFTGMGLDFLTEESILSVKSSKITFNGKEYYAENIQTTVVPVLCAFDGSTLKYLVYDARMDTLTKCTENVDSSLFQLPETIMTEEQYCAAYMSNEAE